MNKIINKLWVLILLIFPVNVYAMTGGLNVSCSPKTVRAGETVTCTIAGTSDEVVSAVEAQVSILNDKVTIESFTKNDAWSTGNIENTNYFNVSAENSTIKDNFTVGTLTLKISGDAIEPNDIRVNVQNVSFTDTDDNKISEGLTGSSATFSIEGKNEPQVPTTVKGLKNLQVTGGELISLLEDNSGIIKLNSDTSTFGIVGVPNNESDSVVCKNEDLSKDLECNSISFVGNPTMNIKIVVGSGDTQVTYSINIIKETVIEPAELATLTVGGQTVNLQSGKLDGYKVTLENVSNYLISWTLKDSEHYEVTNFTSNPTSHSGEGEFGITIEPKDKSSGLKPVTYSIQVVKAGGNPTEQPTQRPISPSNNPQTGGTSAIVMAIILFLSLGASIYFYQRNMSSYN